MLGVKKSLSFVFAEISSILAESLFTLDNKQTRLKFLSNSSQKSTHWVAQERLKFQRNPS